MRIRRHANATSLPIGVPRQRYNDTTTGWRCTNDVRDETSDPRLSAPHPATSNRRWHNSRGLAIGIRLGTLIH